MDVLKMFASITLRTVGQQ